MMTIRWGTREPQSRRRARTHAHLPAHTSTISFESALPRVPLTCTPHCRALCPKLWQESSLVMPEEVEKSKMLEPMDGGRPLGAPPKRKSTVIELRDKVWHFARGCCRRLRKVRDGDLAEDEHKAMQNSKVEVDSIASKVRMGACVVLCAGLCSTLRTPQDGGASQARDRDW